MNLVLGVIPKKISNRIFLFVAAVILTGGFFAVSYVLAVGDAVITPASGGEGISIDTTSHASCLGANCGTFIELSGPSIAESAPGNIAAGTHTISLPLGWKFKPGATVKVIRTAGNISPAIQDAALTADTLSFTIDQISTDISSLAFILNSMQVGPTGTSPSAGNMTHSGAAISGVENGVTNFGIFSTIAGTVTQLTFTTPPSDTVYGSTIGPVTVVRTQDQFGNNSTSGLIATEMVSLALTGTGVLQGTASLNIGTGGGTPGTVTFTDLKVSGVDAVGTKGLTASATGRTSAISGNFEITKKPLTATVTVNDKTYDGNNSAVITDVTLDGIVTWDETPDDVTVDNQGTATFASPNASTGIVVTSNGVTIIGAHIGNYFFGGTATGNANITPLEITIIPDIGQTKVYGEAEPTFAYDFTPALITPDEFTGELGRVEGDNVGTYAYILGTLEDGLDNYVLTLTPETFEITQRPITVEATASSKVYDGNTTSAGIPTITVGILATGDSANFMQVYSTTNVNTGKKLTPSGTAGGNSGNNYIYTFNFKMNGAITEKELTITGLSAGDKTYDGTTDAVVSGTPVLEGKVGDDEVALTGTTVGEFNTANVGDNTVSVTGLSLTGGDQGNYTLTQPVLNANIAQLGITGSFTTENKVYDGNTTAVVLTQSLTGVLSADVGNVILTGGTANFADENVADGLVVTASDMTLSGSASGNYSLTSVSTETANITQKTLTATVTVQKKVVDGNNSATITDVELVGVVTGDDVTVDNDGIATFDNIGVGLQTVSVTGVTILGDDVANYSFDNTATGTGEILAVPTVVYVDDSWAGTVAWTNPDGPATYFGYDAFATIQEGIDAVADGGTVNVVAGTYAESLTIDRTLSVIGVGSTSIIQPAIDQDGIVISADGVLIQGLKISTSNTGATTPATPNIAISIQGTTGVEINNNIIETIGDEAMGIWVGGSSNGMDPSTNLKIVGNSITINGVATGIYAAHSAPAHTGWTIGGSAIDANSVTMASANPLELYDVTNSEVSYNTFTITSAANASNVIWSSELSNLSNLTFSNNTVSGSSGSQVAFLADFISSLGDNIPPDTSVSVVTISGNTFSDWGLRGLRIGDGVTSVVVNENSFSDTGEALKNEDATGVDAENNWWGTAVLSTIDGKTNGTIDFEPYYVESGMSILSSVAVNTAYVDSAYSDGAGNGGHYFGYDAFATIQEGIDAVASNGTVNVAIGTYDEQLQINKDITISGAAGATIQPTGDDNAWDIQFVAGGSGATFEGFTLDFNGATDNRAGRGIAVSDLNGPAVTNVTIQNNDITMGVGIGAATEGLEGVGIQTGRNADVGGLQILDNDFHGRIASITDGDTQGEEGIYINPTTGTGTITISGNTFDGGLFTGISVEADNVTVSGNTVTGTGSIQNTQGIRVNDFGTESDYTVTISGNNTVSGFENGLRLGSASDNGSTLTISVTGNTIFGNTRGVWVRHDAVVTASENLISGNTTGAEILTDSNGSLNAVGNWWGSIEGPTIASNPHGNGNAIVGSVTYASWCTETDCDPYDVDAPAAILTNAPASSSNSDLADVTVGGTDVVYYKYKLDGGAYGDETLVATHITLASLGDGSHTLSVIGRDQAGNWQAEGSATTHTWTVDTGIPTAPTVSLTNPINISNNSSVAITGTGEANAVVNYTITDVAAQTITGSGAVSADDEINITGIDVSSLNDGAITLSVTLTDSAGNPSTAGTDSATKDTVAPTAAETTPVAALTNDATPDIVITVENGAGWEIKNGSDVLNTGTGNGAAQTVTLATLTDNTYNLSLVATDAAGNQTTVALTQFIVDATAPTLTLDSMFTDQTLTGGNVYPINWTASDTHLGDTSVKVEYSINGGSTWHTPPIVDNSNNDGAENWTVPSTNTSNGKVRVTVTDLATNVSTAISDTFSITYSIVTDSTAPVATLNSPNGGETWENNAAHLITWTATDNITAAASLDIKLEYSTDGGIIWTTIIADTENDGAYSWMPTGVNSTNVLVKVTATDAAGLTGSDISNTALTIATPVAYPESICTGSSPYSCSISLSTGWNLISLPIIPTNTAIADVLAGISGVGTVDLVKYYDSTDPDDWKSYIPGGGGGELTAIEDGKGYWISMTAPATLTVTGTSAPAAPFPPSTYSVISGWNLIGYKSLTAYQNASAYLSSIPSGYIVFDQNNTNKTSSYLQHGKGYWLWSTGAGSIVAGD